MPTLWGNGNTGSQDWNRLEAFKSMNWNPQYVQGFYEPDCSPPMSSAIDPWTAAALWKSTIYPWKWKGATLVSPGMCKQADEDWLTPFKQAIGDDFMWDITSVHINKVDMDGVRKVLDHYWNTYGKPMFVTEVSKRCLLALVLILCSLPVWTTRMASPHARTRARSTTTSTALWTFCKTTAESSRTRCPRVWASATSGLLGRTVSSGKSAGFRIGPHVLTIF
jgi:hypothetical protein